MADGTDHGPMESYQWSAAKVDYTTRFFHQLARFMAIVLLICTIALMVFNTVAIDTKIDCETGAFNHIIAQLAAAQQAQDQGRPPPKFTYPAPC